MKELTHLKRTLFFQLRLLSLLMVATLCASEVWAQNSSLFRVSGNVVDSSSQPLVGASVVSVSDKSQGVTTDLEGNFSLSVKKGDKISVSFLGYHTRIITINNADRLQVVLSEDAMALEQVVVVSYGTAKKQEIIGSVTSVDVSDINSVPTTRMEQALQGKVAGVMVTPANGEPGAGMNIVVRGVGTIGNSDPLYIIDGIPTKTGMNYLNPNDVESISVLKDASASAMYGSRAANGVVLITTKKGKEGRFTLDFDAYWGVQTNMKKFDMLNASEWASIRNEAFLNDNPGGKAPWKSTNLGRGTDWQDEILRNAMIQNYNVGVTGGSEKFQYAVSMNHFQQNGIIKYSDYERNSVRANLIGKPVKWLEIGNNSSFSYLKKEGVDIEVNGVLKNAILAVPTMKVYNEDGSFAGPNTILEGNTRNPLSMAANADNHSKMFRVTNNSYAKLNLAKGLSVKSSFALDLLVDNSRDFSPSFIEGGTSNLEASLFQRLAVTLNWIWENVLNYNFNIGRSGFKFLAGFSMEENGQDWMSAMKSNFVGNYDFLQYLSNGSMVAAGDVRGSLEEWSMISYFSRLDYNFDDRYLLSASVRADGSSRFARGNRYSVFPSFAAGWRLSEESFAKDSEWLDNLKIKASWGQLGNQDIGLYAFCGTLDPFYYNINGKPVVGYAPGAAFNKDISWETTSQADFGFEFSAFRGALSLEADYYIKTTKDMLVQLPVSLTSGFGSGPFVNAGKIRNTGIELTLSHHKQLGDFRYDISANFTSIKNKVLSLGGSESPIDDTIFFDYMVRTQKGEPMRQMYGYVMEGIYQNEAEIADHMFADQSGFRPGDVRYSDLNKNGRLDPGDRTVIGNTLPKYLYGVNLSFSYKGFDFMAQMQGVGGNDIYNVAKFWSENTADTHNYGKAVLNSWRGEGTSNTMPRLTLGSTRNNIASTRYVESGNYFRCKNLQIGYTFPRKWISKLHLRSMRVYFNAQNLFTITNYSGFNPEVGTSRMGNMSSYGLDEITYPQARVFTFGINLGIF